MHGTHVKNFIRDVLHDYEIVPVLLQHESLD